MVQTHDRLEHTITAMPQDGNHDSIPIKSYFGTNGVMELYHIDDLDQTHNLFTVPEMEEYTKDYSRLVEMVNEGFMRSYCFQRLQLLSSAF